MCGRYAASRRPEDLVGLFDVQKWDPRETLEPDWNVAPTKDVWAILERPVKGDADPNPVRQLRALRWGLVPSFAKTPETGVKMINARAETIHEKPAYRRAFASRRCLLPADGYYEWLTPQAGGKPQGERKGRQPKQPYFVTPADGSVMALAGLFEFWRDRTVSGDDPRAWWVTCTVVTTQAETEPFAGADGGSGPQALADIHPRMPLVIEPAHYAAWLDPERSDPDDLRSLLAPPAPGRLMAYPVSTEVSNARNNGPQLTERVAEQDPHTLF